MHNSCDFIHRTKRFGYKTIYVYTIADLIIYSSVMVDQNAETSNEQ